MDSAVVDSDMEATQRLPIFSSSSSVDVNSNDILIRIRQDENKTTFTEGLTVSISIPPNVNITVTPDVSIAISPIARIIQPLKDMMDEHYLYGDVIRNLWKIYKYHQEYQSFLLGGCTEEEFLAVAERYATTFQHMAAGKLMWASLLLFNIMDDSLTSSDLSVLLNVDPSEIENTLASSSNIYAIPLEYQETHGE
jgi:hypothetical protein